MNTLLPRRRLLIFSAIVLVLLSSLAIASLTGSPGSYVTNAPGEGSCKTSGCHSSATLQTGLLTISSGLTTTYRPSEVIPMFLKQSSNVNFEGFQVVALDSLGNSAGSFSSPGPGGKLVSFNSRGYVTHSSNALKNQTSWTWTAPATNVGSVHFYAVALTSSAGNLYTGTRSYPFTATCCIGTVGNVDCDGAQNVDIGDLTVLVDNLFVSFAPLCCSDEADLDHNGSIDIGDLTLLVDNLFVSFTPLAGC